MNVTKTFYHGDDAKTSFFEGWYFKHRVGETVLAVIPGMAVAKDGTKSAFIQCIHNGGSCVVRYPFDRFSAREDRLEIRVGESTFSEQGMHLHLPEEGIVGDIAYDAFTPIRRTPYAPSMMGPFSYLHFLECYHDVLSTGHGLSGCVTIGGKEICFTGGRGYLEKDWGRSFPKSWVWLECSEFDADVRVMAAVAEIPFCGGHFTGILCSLSIGGQTHRIATYHGAHIHRMEARGDAFCLELTQGGWRLLFETERQNGAALYAPLLGDMCRTIEEYPACSLKLRVYRHGDCLFDGVGKNAGFEQVSG